MKNNKENLKDEVIIEDKPLVGLRGKKNSRTKLPMGQLLSICFVKKFNF